MTLQLAAVTAMQTALAAGDRPPDLVSFEQLQELVGFPGYVAAEERYR